MPIEMSPCVSVRIRDFGVDSFLLSIGLSFRRDSCSVLHEVHMFIAWPQSPNSCSLSRRERTEIVSIGAFLKKKEVQNGGQLFIWIYTISCTLYIHQGHERFSVLSTGRSAMLFREPVSLLVR